MPAISIIVPVFNSEEFLENAIISILNQSFKDFELILVNDASSDDSHKICDKYRLIDKRIKVIHFKENQGICKARNAGLEIAIGEYIAFSDDDDYYNNNLLEENYKLAKKYDADMVKFGRELIDVDKNYNIIRSKKTEIEKLFILENEELKSEFFKVKSLNVLVNVWNGLYKKKIIKAFNIRFDEEMRFGSEDAEFSLNYYSHTKKLVINPNCYYVHYRRNATSTSRKYNLNKINSLIKTVKTEQRIWEFLDDTTDNKTEIIRSVNNSIINIILVQLLHPDCDLSSKQKIKMISSFKQYSYLNYEINDKSIIKKLIKISPSQGIFTILYSKNKYKSLLILLKLYDKIFGLKW